MASFDKSQPHAKPTDLHRYEIDGDYSGRWEIYTDYAREQLLKPGFFQTGGRTGIERLHLIDCWCEFRTTKPTRMTVVVTRAAKGVPVEVMEMPGTFQVTTPDIPWFKILDCPVESNSAVIRVAFKRMVQKMAPNKKQMARLERARDHGMEVNVDRD